MITLIKKVVTYAEWIVFGSLPEELFCKKYVLENFEVFTGKHLCRSLFFNKVADLRSSTSIKRDSDMGFFANFAKFLRTLFSENTYGSCLWIVFGSLVWCAF